MQRMTVSALALVALLGSPALAQRGLPDQETLKKRLAIKTGEKWLKDPKWITDYDQALAEAKKSGKVIFGYFTRSYAY